MKYVVYKTTNLVNSKYYIGVHRTNDPNDDYLGSGKLIKRAIKKYGVSSFKKEILFLFDSVEDAYNKEKELVTLEEINSEICYNLKEGGEGGWGYVNNNPKIRIPKNQKAQRAMMETKFYTTEQYKKNKSNEMLQQYKDGRRQVVPPSFKGKKHSSDTIQKFKEQRQGRGKGKSNSQFGSKWITNGIENKKIKSIDSIPEGWDYGRTCTR